jgi:hypothetical protein
VNYPVWQFRKMNKGEMNVDPIEGEFFSTEALGSLPDALIREAIQNSLDAVTPKVGRGQVYFLGMTPREESPEVSGEALWNLKEGTLLTGLN